MIHRLTDIVDELANDRGRRVRTYRSQANILDEFLWVLFHETVVIVVRHEHWLEEIHNKFLLAVHLRARSVLPFRFQVGSSGMVQGGSLDSLVGLDISKIA